MAKFNANLMFIAILTFLTFNSVGATLVSCTFDSDLCGWHIVGPGKFRWKRGSGMTDDRSSGPLNDHTCANYQGKYMFISGGDAESINDIAVLESKQFNISKETTFTLWYTMNGYGSGLLTLTIIADNKPTEVWKIEGRQGKDWLNYSVTLKPGTLKLQFKSTVRIPVGSDLAIDDLHLSSEYIEEKNKTHCQTSTTTRTATTTQSTTTSTTTTTSLPTTTTEEQKNKTHKFSSLTTSSYPSSSASLCSRFAGRTRIMPGTCDFENGTCGNKIIASQANREVTWERTDKMEGNKYQDDFIIGDHTFQTNGTRGKYLLFKNSWGWSNPKRIASVETPAIYATFACVTFWYTVPSNYSNVKVLIRDYTGRLTTLWEVDNFFQNKRASNMTGWHKQILSVFEDPPFTVVFQAYNNYHLAKVGLDDIKILGANISTGMTRPASDKTTPVISLTPGTTPHSTQMYPGTTKMFTVPKSTKQAASLISVKQTPPNTQNKISTSSPYVRSTEKGHTKSTVSHTKKATEINDEESDTEKQSKESEDNGKTSTVVGGVVGVLLFLILIIVIAYAINYQKHRRNRLTQTQEKLNGKHHQNSNGKVSNGALNSEVHLHVDVGNEKPKSNGHATTINETPAAFCVNTVYSNLQHSEQMNGNVNFNNHPPLTTDITEMSVKL